MTDEPRRPRSAVPLHIVAVLAVPACLAAGLFELRRAQSGNELSWAYVVEWPLIAGYGLYLWARLVRERRAEGRPEAPAGSAPPADADAVKGTATGQTIDPADPELVAWQAYLADLHAHDPPGGPGRTP